MTRLICIAGAESSGKSSLAVELARHFKAPFVEEYALGYCAEHGNDLDLGQLRHIAETQDAMVRAALDEARANGVPLVIADTDALVTAVWIETMLGDHDAARATKAVHADLYLVTANDLPWVDDGIRIQRALDQRALFRRALAAEIQARGLLWAGIGGAGPLRMASALAAIRSVFPQWPDPHLDMRL